MAHLELVHVAEDESRRPRPDHDVIAQLIDENASVLEIGCAGGALIQKLQRERGARVRGLERDKVKVRQCVGKGLSVVQGDALEDLAAFPSATFKYVVFSKSLQTVERPREALRQAARIGERIIVSIDNFAYWRARLRLLYTGRAPLRQRGEQSWADHDALRPCSIRDFAELARDMRLGIETAVPLTSGRVGGAFAKTLWRSNWFAEEAVFLLAP